MSEDWSLDNPAKALQEYYNRYNEFIEKKESLNGLKKTLAPKKQKYEAMQKDLNAAQKKLNEYGEYSSSDVDTQVNNTNKKAERTIFAAKQDFEAQKKALSDKKTKDIQDNDLWLKNRLAELNANDTSGSKELTENEKKALEFETARREFTFASNERINQYQDSITQEKLDCAAEVGNWQKEQNEITNAFAPKIDSFDKQINKINSKHAPYIETCQERLSLKIADRDDEIGTLETNRAIEKQNADNEILAYRSEIKNTENEYNRQIRVAKKAGAATTRLENSKASRVNALYNKINKVSDKANKKITAINQQINAAASKHDKLVSKAEAELNSAVNSRDNELKEPTIQRQALINDRDNQVRALQDKINERQGSSNEKIIMLQANISDEQQQQHSNDLGIDAQIVVYVMNGDNCLNEILENEYVRFGALEKRVDKWMELLNDIAKEKMSEKYPKKYSQQKESLIQCDYETATNLSLNARNFNDKISSVVRHNQILKKIELSVAAASLLLAIVLYAILKKPLMFLFLLMTFGSLFLWFCISIAANGQFEQICRYIIIAMDYREFECLMNHSTQVTKERELERMKKRGSELYDVYHGKARAQKHHDEKDADIKADYERELQLLKIGLQNIIDTAIGQRDMAIRNTQEKAAKEREQFNSEKSQLKNNVQILTKKTRELDTEIRTLENQIGQICIFVDNYEKAYKIFAKKLEDKKWRQSEQSSDGTLSDELYIVPEEGAEDNYGYKKVYRVSHGKKPLVITYNPNDADGEGSETENLGKLINRLIKDLMRTIYRMNYEDIYKQYIVNEVGGTDELQNLEKKNQYNIDKIVGKISDIKRELQLFISLRESLAEKGTTMDELNRKAFTNGDRPETYKICYFVFNANDHKNRLDEDIIKLTSKCYKYGFFPIFICDSEVWNTEIASSNDSIYKDIKKLLSNPIVSYECGEFI